MYYRCKSCIYNNRYISRYNNSDTPYFCSLNHEFHPTYFKSDDIKEEEDPAINCSDYLNYRDYINQTLSISKEDYIYRYNTYLSEVLPISVELIKARRRVLGKYTNKLLLAIHSEEWNEYKGYMYFYKKELKNNKENDKKYKYGNLIILFDIYTYTYDNYDCLKKELIGKVLLEVCKKDVNNDNYTNIYLRNLSKSLNNSQELNHWIYIRTQEYKRQYHNLIYKTELLLRGLGIKSFIEYNDRSNENIIKHWLRRQIK